MKGDRRGEEGVERISLAEETVRVEKRQVEAGRVRVRSVTDTVDEVARATLDTESVEVTRVPIDREIEGAAPSIRDEDGVTVIPVLEEILVVEKRLVLKEELHIRRRVTQENVEVPVTLRKTRAVVERLGPDGRPAESET